MIEIQQLSYHYTPHIMALDGINLRVEKGEKVALLGPNGAGKTTLLLHLNGILRGSGLIRVNGLELDEKNLLAIRAMVGLVFQSPDDQLFSASVYDDVAYGPIYQGLGKAEIDERVKRALAEVGLAGLKGRSPHRLSLGEKRRAALATVLSMQPDILALDEPTAGLDPRGRREFIALMRTLPQTIIAATHDMELVKSFFPRIVMLDGGRLAYDGPARAAFKQRDLLEKHGLV